MRTRNSLLLLLPLMCVSDAPARGTGAAAAARHSLMPVPASVRFNDGRLSVGKSFGVAARGHTDARLRAAVERFLRRLEGRTVVELPRGLGTDAGAASLVIEAAGRAAVCPRSMRTSPTRSK